MATLGSLIVRLGTDNRDLIKGYDEATRRTTALADALETIGSRLTIGVTAPAIALGAASVRAAADIEVLRKGLEAVAPSAQAAADQYERLVEIAKLPGITFESAAQTAITLQGIGWSAQEAERAILAVGRAIAASGGGKAEFSGVVRQLRQVAGLGRLMGEELNIIIENAPVMARALTEAFGSTNAEHIRSLGLSTEQFFDRFFTAVERGVPLIEGGLLNAFENLGTAIKRSLGNLAEGEVVNLTRTIDNLAERVENASEVFANLSSTTQRTILVFGGLAAAIGPATIAASALVRAYQTLIGLSVVSQVAGATRAFFALVPAIKSARDAMYLFGVASRGVLSIFTGPAGLITILGGLAAAWFGVKIDSAEAAAEAERSADRIINALQRARDSTSQIELVGQAAGLLKEQEDVLAKMDELAARGATMQNSQEFRRLTGEAAQLEIQIQQTALSFGVLANAAGDSDASAAATLDEIGKRALALLTIYNRLTVRGENATQALREMLAISRSLNAQIASGTLNTEDLAKALDIVGEISDLLNETLSDSVAEGLRDASQQFASDMRRIAMDPIKFNFHLNAAGGVVLNETIPAEISRVLMEGARRAQQENTNFLPASALEPAESAIANIMERLAEFGDEAQVVEGAAQGLLAIGDALGVLGEDARRALTGVLAISQGIQTLQRAQASTGISQVVGVLGGAAGIVGGVISAVSGLAALFSSQEQQSAEMVAALRSNEAAMRDLRLSLSGFRPTFGSQADAVSALESAIAMMGRSGVAGLQQFRPEFLTQFLAPLGLSLDELIAVADKFGITLFEGGRIIPQAVEDLIAAVRDTALSVQRFGKTLDGQRALMDARNEIFDVTNPVEILEAQLDILAKQAPNLFADLANLNLDSEAAQTVLENALRDLFIRLKDGGLTAEDLEGFTSIQEFLDALTGTDQALDRLQENANKAADAAERFANVPEIFDLALRRRMAGAGVGSGLGFGSPTDMGGNLKPGGGAVYYFDFRGASGMDKDAVMKVLRDNPEAKFYIRTAAEGR